MTDNAPAHHVFGANGLQSRVAAAGAELQSLQDPSGFDRVWSGAAWPRHSPVLFPIVGTLKDDTALIDGRPYRLTRHGFARDRVFHWVDRRADGCTLSISDDADSRAIFPFRFVLTMDYQITGQTLHVGYRVHNPDPDHVLLAALGAHPAFSWPQRPGAARQDYVLEFEHPEPAPIRRIADGLLLPTHFPTPITGRTLALSDDLFIDDVVILDQLTSTRVAFRAPDGTGMTMTWQGFRELGLWMKPGAGFLCIEPWRGLPSPVDFSGEFSEKPGILHIPPLQDWTASWSVALL
ncbi:aldose 1-epimerase family protein [Nguyenibacter sp. L1]|uniref:aldose 1-epimerase family protein n=1 Tax=Nguyenibacter sp. L1 TaxID=3049350 RepID=UPI002B466A44|nr:aldose 1-epimerase family protein [Nguyenibacter sp. L1]WRH86590.1 aldose 1-epimerase family protein [Nguyenibacter sp. L1]